MADVADDMLQTGEDGECSGAVADLLSSGRVSRMNEVPVIARGIGLFERARQLRPLSMATRRRHPTAVARAAKSFLQASLNSTRKFSLP